MSHPVLLDIDPVLLGRIQRLAAADGWSEQQVMIHLIEHGLFVCEADLAARFDTTDAQAMQEALAALQDIPDDPGFSLIGRVNAADAGPPFPGQAG